MALWQPIAVLPNVELSEAIDGRRAAFVPMCHERVQEINKAHPRHRSFLRRFTDAFGVRLSPTVLLLRPNASRRYMEADAVASFRNVLSMSVVPRSRALSIQYRHTRGVNFSKAFDLYPWAIDKNYEGLVAITPALMAVDDVRKFKGQSAPEMSGMRVSTTDLDQPLFNELAKRWRRSYGPRKPTWEDVALMRSLNMAHHACQFPDSVGATLHDYGRLVALWVSAFEILVHPGPGGKTNQWEVYNLLERMPCMMRENRRRNLKCRARKQESFERRPLPSWLYQQLYRARNDFLHGNPINTRQLHLPGSKRILESFAAPLYRMALASFLDLRWKGELPPQENDEAFARAISESLTFDSYQRDFEVAIAISRGYEPGRAVSRARFRPAP